MSQSNGIVTEPTTVVIEVPYIKAATTPAPEVNMHGLLLGNWSYGILDCLAHCF